MKNIILILLVLIMCFALGCSSAKEQLPLQEAGTPEPVHEVEPTSEQDPAAESDPSKEPVYTGNITYIESCSPWYVSAEELDEAVDGILLCRVTGESFRVYNERDGSVLPNALDRSQSPMIYTVYSIEPVACFKGDYSDLTEVRIDGTHLDHDIEAQMAACGFTSPNQVPRFLGKQPDIEIGRLYVFALSQFGTSTPCIHLRTQSVFPLEGDPDKIECDEIMLKELIGLYGEDAWNTVVSYCDKP